MRFPSFTRATRLTLSRSASGSGPPASVMASCPRFPGEIL